MIRSFDELIAPISSADFLKNYFERSALHLERHGQDSGHDLFCLDDAELIMRQHRHEFRDFVRIATKGKIILPQQSGSIRGAWEWILHERQEGATIIIDYLQRYSLPITRLARGLAADFGCTFDISAFLTPENSRGIAAHCDQMHVFILQIEGRKRWRLYGDAGPYYVVDSENLGEPTHDITLHPGELLYIPCGTIHQGSTQESASLSLSIVQANPIRWIDMIDKVVDIAAETDVSLRRTVPLRQLQEINPEYLEEHISKLLKQVRNKQALSSALTRIKQGLIVKMSLPASRLGRSAAALDVQPDDLLEKLPGTPCHIYSHGSTDDKVHLCFPECVIDGLPRQLEPALRFIANSTCEFHVRELPGGIQFEAKQALIKRLLREGLLRRVDGRSNDEDTAWHPRSNAETPLAHSHTAA